MVRRAIETTPERVVGSYLGSVAVGLVGLAVVLPGLHLAVGEAMQLHALVNLGTAAVVSGTTLAAVVSDGDTSPVAVSLGVAAGATTVLMVAMQFSYFEYGAYALPIGDVLADIPAVVP